MKKTGSRSLFVACLTLFIATGCIPPPTYKYSNNTPAVKQLAANEVSNTRVSASIEDWRNSGVQVIKGQKYRISASGKWRTYPSCNFTDADGVGLYTEVSYCTRSPLYPPIIEGYSHSTLIAKIGSQGKPFVVGQETEFTAQNDGVLFFRINDAVNTNHDNEGFVDATITASGPQTASSSAAMANEKTPIVQSAIPASAAVSASNTQIPLDVIQSISPNRTALVIGNSDYANSPLKNPVNDARSMADSLKQLGFDVSVILNANQQQMESAIDDFGRKLMAGNHVALFYFAGHGVQVDGENYLIPTDAIINRQADVRYKAVNIGQVLGTMGEAEDNLNIVILDACRDNPLPRSFRNASRGLARVEGPKGTIIGFATSPGSVAADGEGDNGVYTKHLLSNMQHPGLSIEQVFKKVLQGVNEETDGLQIPWTESSFTGDFTFRP